jgi:hypothetical protein
LPGTNTLAYFASSLDEEKKFYAFESSSDEAGKKLVARGRSRQKLVLSESSVDDEPEKVAVAAVTAVEASPAVTAVPAVAAVEAEEKKSEPVEAPPAEAAPLPEEKAAIKTEPEVAEVLPPVPLSTEEEKKVETVSVPATIPVSIPEVLENPEEIVKKEDPVVEETVETVDQVPML